METLSQRCYIDPPKLYDAIVRGDAGIFELRSW